MPHTPSYRAPGLTATTSGKDSPCFLRAATLSRISTNTSRNRTVLERSDRSGGGYVRAGNCLAKSYYFPATREAGLVQNRQCTHRAIVDPKRPDSDCRPSHGQTGSNFWVALSGLRPDSLIGRLSQRWRRCARRGRSCAPSRIGVLLAREFLAVFDRGVASCISTENVRRCRIAHRLGGRDCKPGMLRRYYFGCKYSANYLHIPYC